MGETRMRIDLGRVGITPHPSRLCTEAAKEPEIIRWADGRARLGVAPPIVLEQREIDLSDSGRELSQGATALVPRELPRALRCGLPARLSFLVLPSGMIQLAGAKSTHGYAASA